VGLQDSQRRVGEVCSENHLAFCKPTTLDLFNKKIYWSIIGESTCLPNAVESREKTVKEMHVDRFSRLDEEMVIALATIPGFKRRKD
jgi:hypothetical protein